MPPTAVQTPSTASIRDSAPIQTPAESPAQAPRRRADSVIPPDLQAVLTTTPVHPELLRYVPRQAAPTAAVLSRRALEAAEHARAWSSLSEGAAPATDMDAAQAGSVIYHAVGAGGALRLSGGTSLRALTVAFGSLSERGSSRPVLLPGTVRLVPAGISLTLAELSGRDAVVVEVAL